jgi:hypothetical protein
VHVAAKHSSPYRLTISDDLVTARAGLSDSGVQVVCIRVD